MRWVKFLAVFALMALLLSIAPGVVRADGPTPNYSDPSVVQSLVERLGKAGDKSDGLWGTLTPEAKAAVVRYLKVERVAVQATTAPGTISPLVSGCTAWRGFRYVGYNYLGQALWAYNSQIQWCSNGSSITSKSHQRWAEVLQYFWSFTGHIGESEGGGIGQTYYEYWTQGAFQLCFPGVGCVQYVYPWIDLIGYRDLTWTYSYGQ